MKRAKWLQDRRMQKFQDVLSRWEAGALSMMEAGELLGMLERQFRRYRYRFEEDGLDGLKDRRLGKASPKRVAASERDRMLVLYREAAAYASRAATEQHRKAPLAANCFGSPRL